MKIATFKNLPLMGIVRGVAQDAAEPLVAVVVAAGLTTIEITMNTTDASLIIKKMRSCAPETLTIGAGTVLDVGGVKKAGDAGASFIVSPTFIPEVVEYCVKQSLPVFPGALTPQEIFTYGSDWQFFVTDCRVAKNAPRNDNAFLCVFCGCCFSVILWLVFLCGSVVAVFFCVICVKKRRNNMKRNAVFVGIMAAMMVVVMSMPGYAGDWGKGSKLGCGGADCGKMHKKPGWDDKLFMAAHMMLRNQDELGLTDEQIASIKDIKTSTKKEMIRRKADIEIIAVDLKAMMWDDVIDVKAMSKLIDEKYELKKAKAKVLLQAHADLKNVLTAEQKETLKTLCKPCK